MKFDYNRLASGAIGFLAVLAMLLIGFGYPSIGAIFMFVVALIAAASLIWSI